MRKTRAMELATRMQTRTTARQMARRLKLFQEERGSSREMVGMERMVERELEAERLISDLKLSLLRVGFYARAPLKNNTGANLNEKKEDNKAERGKTGKNDAI